jgi:hypothetical protein
VAPRKKKSTKKSSKKKPMKKTSASKKAKPIKKKTTKKKKTTVRKTTPVKKQIKKKTKKSVTPKKKKSTKKSKAPKKGGKSKSSVKPKKRNYSEIDHSLLDLLTSQSDHILYFDAIEESLHLSEEDIKKAIKRLENKQPPKITSKLVMEGSRWIIQIKLVESYGAVLKHSKKANNLIWETANDLPCFICPYIGKCSDGQELYNPKTCPYLSDWLISTVDSSEPFMGNPFHPDFTSKKSKSKAAAEAKAKIEEEAKLKADEEAKIKEDAKTKARIAAEKLKSGQPIVKQTTDEK